MSKIFDKSGVTLIEIVVSLAILGLFVVPITSMFTTNMRLNSQSRGMAETTALANRIIERIDGADLVETGGDDPIEFTVGEYGNGDVRDLVNNKYGITSHEKNNYKIFKKIGIISQSVIESNISEKVVGSETLLNIDTTTAGEIHFYGLDRGEGQTYFYVGDNPTINIKVEDTVVEGRVNVKIGNNTYANGGYKSFCIRTSEKHINLHLVNASKSEKTVYVAEPESGVDNVVVDYEASPSRWNIFDKVKYESSEQGEVSIAQIEITVENKRTGYTYKSSISKPLYKFD